MREDPDTTFLGVRCKYCGSTIVLAATGKLPDEISLPCDDCGRRGLYACTATFVMLPAEARERKKKGDQAGFGRRSTP